MLSNSPAPGSDGSCAGTSDSCPGVRPNWGQATPPSIHTSPSRPLVEFGGLLAENASGERLCPIRSRINAVMTNGARVTICAPLAINGYGHRTPLERSCVEAIHGAHRAPECVFPKLGIGEAFIEGSSVAESSWTTSPLEAAADEGREAYGSSVLGYLLR